MGPDTLMALVPVDRVRTHWEGCSGRGHEWCEVARHADAWEAEQDEALRIITQNNLEIVALMKRLEAAELKEAAITAAIAENTDLYRRLEAAERGQLEFIAMLCHNNGGEIRMMPVLLRGDEEVVMWDDPLTLERVYRIRPPALAAGEDK